MTQHYLPLKYGATITAAARPTVNRWSVPFLMQPLPHATVSAMNPFLPYEGDAATLLRRFAWAVPECGIDQAEATRVFYADRYGGLGAGRNGGGARCASDGAWQIKGCGVNPLAGIENDGSIRLRGTATLAQSIQEALWSEIFHHALPFGATQVVAVIRTGLRDQQAAREVDKILGTVVREAAWRPAHFQRAHEFRPAPVHATALPSDSARVREAIAELDLLLPVPANYVTRDWLNLRPLVRLNAGLEEMVRRFAEQLAASVAKRLMHGTLTASNICLDGRWIDFATASALPGWANRIKCFTPLTEECWLLTRPLTVLCFYIQKYFPVSGEDKQKLPHADHLVQVYVLNYRAALERRMAGLSGCQGMLADAVWDDPSGQSAMRQLAQSLMQLGTSGRSSRYGSADYPALDTRSGDFDVLAILDVLFAPAAREEDTHLRDLVPSAAMREQLLDASAEICAKVDEAAVKRQLAQGAIRRLMQLYRRKAAMVEPLFCRDKMNAHVEQLVLDSATPEALLQKTDQLWRHVRHRARLLYADPAPLTCLLWCDDEGELTYDATQDALIARSHGLTHQFSWSQFFNGEDLPGIPHGWCDAIRASWGPQLGRML